MSASENSPFLRRKFPRRRMARPAGILLHGAYSLCTSLDVSESGVSIDISSSPELKLVQDDEVLITFKIPSSLFIVARARVQVRKEPVQKNASAQINSFNAALAPGLKQELVQQVALSFIDLTLYQRRLIRDFVSSKASDESVHALELD